MNEFSQHDAIWNERLQDVLDGDVVASERAAVDSHLAACARCRTHFAALKRLDAVLAAHIEAPRLDSSFDGELFARIEAIDARTRDQARQRADDELQQNLRSLTRSWHRGLAFVIGGAIAGVALAFAFTGWIEAAGLSEKLLDTMTGLGLAPVDGLRTVMIAAIGAGIGGTCSWLGATFD